MCSLWERICLFCGKNTSFSLHFQYTVICSMVIRDIITWGKMTVQGHTMKLFLYRHPHLFTMVRSGWSDIQCVVCECRSTFNIECKHTHIISYIVRNKVTQSHENLQRVQNSLHSAESIPLFGFCHQCLSFTNENKRHSHAQTHTHTHVNVQYMHKNFEEAYCSALVNNAWVLASHLDSRKETFNAAEDGEVTLQKKWLVSSQVFS